MVPCKPKSVSVTTSCLSFAPQKGIWGCRKSGSWERGSHLIKGTIRILCSVIPFSVKWVCSQREMMTGCYGDSAMSILGLISLFFLLAHVIWATLPGVLCFCDCVQGIRRPDSVPWVTDLRRPGRSLFSQLWCWRIPPTSQLLLRRP